MSHPTMSDAIDGLRQRRHESEFPGRPGSIEKQHAKGKLTARERIALLVDEGTFQEIGALRRGPRMSADPGEKRPFGDGVVTGLAKIDGRQVVVYSQDATILGGSVGQTHAKKLVDIYKLAEKIGCPVVGLNDSGGARIQDGVNALASYSILGNVKCTMSGVVPMIGVIMGTCAGGAVYSPATGDFTLMVNGTSHMFLTGPEVVREVTGEETTMEELGGAEINAITGNAHYVDDTDEEALQSARRLLSFIASNNVAPPPRYAPAQFDWEVNDTDLELDTIVPPEPNKAYDVVDVIERIVDDGDFMEIHSRWATNAVIGFGRVNGHSIGIIANQPMVNGGVMNIDMTEKTARFLRTCDCFNVPVVSLVDVPGALPGLEQERAGAIRRAAKLFYAYAEAKVPTITVTLRKSYGGAYATMGSKQTLNDINLAWPTAEIAVMGGPAAVKVLHGRELLKMLGEGKEPSEVEQEFNDRVAEYTRDHLNPYPAAERGWVDRVIKPHETRIEIARALDVLQGRQHDLPERAHGNIPL